MPEELDKLWSKKKKLISKQVIIHTLKCSDTEELLDQCILYYTDGAKSLDDYSGDGSYEDLYEFIAYNLGDDYELI